MRTIDKAVIIQTIQHGGRLELVGEDFLEEQGRKHIIGLISKYITYQDKKQAYWTDRYWYFDMEKYQKDLEAFGIDFRMAVKEPMIFPRVDQL